MRKLIIFIFLLGGLLNFDIKAAVSSSPVKIQAGTNIVVQTNGNTYTINSTATGGSGTNSTIYIGGTAVEGANFADSTGGIDFSVSSTNVTAALPSALSVSAVTNISVTGTLRADNTIVTNGITVSGPMTLSGLTGLSTNLYNLQQNVLIDGSGNVTANSFISSGEGPTYLDSAVITNSLLLQAATASRFAVFDGSKYLTNDVAATGTGAPVRATSPVLTTPNIGAAIGASLQVDALAYDATSWNGSTNVPTRDDIRDKIESMGSGGYVLNLNSTSTGSLNDNSTYYFGAPALEGHSGVWANVYAIVPKAGTVKWISFRGRCTAGSAETGTNYFRVNDSSDTTLSTSMQWNAARFVNIYSNLNITVSAGDQIAIKVVTPTHATDPSGACANINVYIE